VRLFVAVWPSEDVLDLVAALPRPDLDLIRWTTRDQWHVTLRFLGEVPDPDPVSDALRKISGSSAGVARLGPQSAWFPGNRVLQVPVDGLGKLESSVSRALSRIEPGGPGRRPSAGEYCGHLTLGRVRGRRSLGRDDRIASSGAEIAATWAVESVSLVASVLGRDGSRYTEVARVGLDVDSTDPLTQPNPSTQRGASTPSSASSFRFMSSPPP
jgi:2'-5' RNA ligase